MQNRLGAGQGCFGRLWFPSRVLWVAPWRPARYLSGALGGFLVSMEVSSGCPLELFIVYFSCDIRVETQLVLTV